MKGILNKYKLRWVDKTFLISVIQGVIFLIFSFAINYKASVYAVEKQSNFVTDIVLSNIPVVNVDIFVVEGALLLVCFVILLLAYEPKTIPFVLKSIALFILIRAFSIILTHVGSFPQQVIIDNNWLLRSVGITQKADFFFSGHTGMPFLLALIFWESKKLRIFFLSASIFLGISVLLGHLHYSIDVFAAFFITYTIFHISRRLFKKDYEVLHNKTKNLDSKIRII